MATDAMDSDTVYITPDVFEMVQEEVFVGTLGKQIPILLLVLYITNDFFNIRRGLSYLSWDSIVIGTETSFLSFFLFQIHVVCLQETPKLMVRENKRGLRYILR